MGQFSAKLLTLLGDFPNKADSMSVDDLKKELVKCERTIVQTEKDKEADTKLLDAKREVKDLAKDYDEMIKENKAMIKYIVFTLDERGTP